MEIDDDATVGTRAAAVSALNPPVAQHLENDPMRKQLLEFLQREDGQLAPDAVPFFIRFCYEVDATLDQQLFVKLNGATRVAIAALTHVVDMSDEDQHRLRWVMDTIERTREGANYSPEVEQGLRACIVEFCERYGLNTEAASIRSLGFCAFSDSGADIDNSHKMHFVIKGSEKLLARITRGLEPSAVSHGPCGKRLVKNHHAYKCLDCGADPTCVMCVECFKNSPCVNHNFRLVMSGGGRYDCIPHTCMHMHVQCQSAA